MGKIEDRLDAIETKLGIKKLPLTVSVAKSDDYTNIVATGTDGIVWYLFKIFPDGTYERHQNIPKGVGFQVDYRGCIEERS
jgi:hypothetical protein